MEVLLADIPALGVNRGLAEVLNVLPLFYRQKALRFVRNEDRARSAVSSVLMLSEAVKEYGSARIFRTEYGKPFIKDGFEFNISHSGDFAAYVRGDLPVGVDIEQALPINIADFASFLTPAEYSDITCADDPCQKFYEVWTIREAFSKAAGKGLSLFEEDYSIDYASKTAHYNGTEYRFSAMRLNGYSLAVCAEDLCGMSVRYITAEEWKERIETVLRLRDQ